jgi:uncharacterized membrane protein
MSVCVLMLGDRFVKSRVLPMVDRLMIRNPLKHAVYNSLNAVMRDVWKKKDSLMEEVRKVLSICITEVFL